MPSCGDGVRNASAGEQCDGDAVTNGACTDCSVVCSDGWADCNDHLSDGCETGIDTHPLNCGSCGHDCLGGGCIGGLDARERAIVRRRYLDGDDAGEGPTYAEIAAELGISRERVRQIEIRARRKLRESLWEAA